MSEDVRIWMLWSTRTWVGETGELQKEIMRLDTHRHCWYSKANLRCLRKVFRRLEAWHTCILWGSSILLCISSQALSGWMWSIAAQLFSGLFRDVRLGSSPGSGWANQGPLSRSHYCIVLAVCLGALSCWKVNLCPRSEVLSALEQVFIKDLSVLWSVLCLNLD